MKYLVTVLWVFTTVRNIMCVTSQKQPEACGSLGFICDREQYCDNVMERCMHCWGICRPGRLNGDHFALEECKSKCKDYYEEMTKTTTQPSTVEQSSPSPLIEAKENNDNGSSNRMYLFIIISALFANSLLFMAILGCYHKRYLRPLINNVKEGKIYKGVVDQHPSMDNIDTPESQVEISMTGTSPQYTANLIGQKNERQRFADASTPHSRTQSNVITSASTRTTYIDSDYDTNTSDLQDSGSRGDEEQERSSLILGTMWDNLQETQETQVKSV